MDGNIWGKLQNQAITKMGSSSWTWSERLTIKKFGKSSWLVSDDNLFQKLSAFCFQPHHLFEDDEAPLRQFR